MYTIVDIETTGTGIRGNRITEISIFRHDGTAVVDEFTSLVNPQCPIPYFITALTGIDNEMVEDAPLLSELAPRILEITEGAIFVAHSVNFDYHVIKNEFRDLGIDFIRKKLCTVRLARKLVPGLNSYSLGKLCSSLGIPLTDRHRARGDAHATVLLFELMLSREGSETVFRNFLNTRSQEATLPPALPKDTYSRLPEQPGVYFFKDSRGKIIYVGKAKNIKKRVLGHFYDKSDKEVRLCRDTADISFELSGSEIVALLMESAAIKHHFPLYNRSQKRKSPRFCIFSYEDRNGVMHLAYNKASAVARPLATFYSVTDCRLFLENLCMDFRLCPKFCHLQEQVSSCSHFRVRECGGICRGTETPAAYNRRVEEAVESMKCQEGVLLIKEKGRNPSEEAVVLMRDGCYSGHGFVPRETAIGSAEDILAFIEPRPNTVETQRLLEAYLVKNPGKAVRVG